MKETTGDIFKFIDTHWLVITTNQGWRLNGDNVMGAGLAKYVRDKYPQVPTWYGEFCRKHPGQPKIATYEFSDNERPRRFIMFPTKPLNPSAPHLSWKSLSSLKLIEECLIELAKFGESATIPIMVPLLGCRNGGLKYEDVVPIIKNHLTSDIFTLIYEAQASPDFHI